jgi:RNA polymerase primary sigma factor/RNA polymerase sigma factor
MRSNIFKDDTYSFIRIHDDNTCAGGSQPTHLCGTISSDEEVLSIEDLARQFNVSTKTISRWRDHGLVAQRVVINGRKRVGFLASAVDRFVHENPARIRRGSRFSQLSDDEHDKLIGWARRLASAGACPADVHRRIANRLNRSVETIRYTIKRYDQDHPESAVFPNADGKLRPESCARISVITNRESL